MKRFAVLLSHVPRILTLPGLLLVGLPVLAADDLPKAEQILDKYIEISGGRAAYEKRKSEYASGTVEIMGTGVTGTMESWAAAPNSRVDVINVQGVGPFQQGTNGTEAWELSGIMGPRLKSGAELTEAIREAQFNLPLFWRKLYSKAETVGVETVDGAECYKLTMTPTTGKPETWYFDRKTGLTTKMVRTAVTSMGEIEAEILMQDYKLLEGVLTPMTVIQKAGPQSVKLSLQKVQVNPTIPPGKFDPPEEIKALISKKKAA